MRQSTGKRDELLLAGRKRAAALANFFLEAPRQGANEISDVDLLGGAFDVFVFNPIGAQADIAFHRARKQEWILQHDTIAAS